MNKATTRSVIIQKRNKLTIRRETIALLTTAQLNRVAGGEPATAAISCQCVSADIVCDTSVSTQ